MYLKLLSILPLLPSIWILFHLLVNDPIFSLLGWNHDEHAANAASEAAHAALAIAKGGESPSPPPPTVGAQLLVFIALGAMGYVGTNRLIPSIKVSLVQR